MDDNGNHGDFPAFQAVNGALNVSLNHGNHGFYNSRVLELSLTTVTLFYLFFKGWLVLASTFSGSFTATDFFNFSLLYEIRPVTPGFSSNLFCNCKSNRDQIVHIDDIAITSDK